MFPAPESSAQRWSSRWAHLARAAGIAPDERLLLALSGGADSALLLHLLGAADPRPLVHAVHVDHGLRGEEGRADARFCANLCRALGIPFTLRTLELEAGGGSLEARARQARYRVLAEEARRSGHTTLITGHHADDALETLLWRWIRGTSPKGLRGPAASRPVEGRDRAAPGPREGEPLLRVVRPLLPLRREEVRRLLADRGLTWREDGSNADPRHTRNRVRQSFVPFLERLCGREGLENLRAFGRAVEELEERLAGATAHLDWAPAPYARASRGPGEQGLGGVLDRAELMRLAAPLRRRALWRLLVEGTGRAPGRALSEAVLSDLAAGRCTRHALAGDWRLVLRSDVLHLVPPRHPATDLDPTGPEAQPWLPFPARPGEALPGPRVTDRLPVPGIVTLPDGRRISVERVHPEAGSPPPTTDLEVELDAAGLPPELQVGWPEEGDRFHPLGAPGSKPLTRFLADRGVPREERAFVPVVLAGPEIVWVAGVEPAERHRVGSGTRERLRLTLHAFPPPGTVKLAGRPSRERRVERPLIGSP